MTALTKKLIVSGIAAIAFNASAAFADNAVTPPELSKNAYKILDHFKLHEADLQFDKVRIRDHRGLDVCEDENKDGIADVDNGEYLEQDHNRFSSIIIDENGDQHFAKKQSRGDFIKALEMHNNATGILAFPENEGHVTYKGKVFPVAFVDRQDGETKIARMNTKQPIGDIEKFQTCASLDTKDAKVNTFYHWGDNHLKQIR